MTTRTHALYLALGLVAALGFPAAAHEKGVIRLGSKEVPTGGQLELRGEKLPKSTRVRLELRGTLETLPLADVRTNAAGAFEARLALPAEARAGSYSVVALAADGDIVARAELTVVTTAPAEATPGAPPNDVVGQKGRHTMDTAPGATDSHHPTAEMMKLPVSTTWVERAAILGVLMLSLAGGLLLLRGRWS